MTINKKKNSVSALSILIIITLVGEVRAEDNSPKTYRDSLLTAARAIIDTAHYCALVTIDSSGFPHARTMEPFAPEDDMTIWLGTNRNSEKVAEIERNPKVALYYFDPSATGYVMISGTAFFEDDSSLKEKYWMEQWDAFYTDKENDYLLIKVVPLKLEVLSYRHGFGGDPVTWTPPSVEFLHE